MYKGLTYGLRTLAMAAALAGCGSIESRLEKEVAAESLMEKRRPLILENIPDDKRLDSDKKIADVTSYNRIITPLSHPNPNLAITVGDQASGSDVVGAVDIPQRFSTEPLIPPYEPEVPLNTYALIALGLLGAYLAGRIIGERKERKKSREMVDGLVKKFGTGRSVDDLLRTPPPN